MKSPSNLCNAYVVNTNPASHYSGFFITTCLEMADPDGGTFIEPVENGDEYLDLLSEALDDPFYRVTAKYKSGLYRRVRTIADFYDIKEAVLFVEELTGSPVDIYSN
jgi:hypothetical protein